MREYLPVSAWLQPAVYRLISAVAKLCMSVYMATVFNAPRCSVPVIVQQGPPTPHTAIFHVDQEILLLWFALTLNDLNHFHSCRALSGTQGH